jgi:hypothetical protein
MKVFCLHFRMFCLMFYVIPAFSQPIIQTLIPTSAVPGAIITLQGSGFNTTSAANFVYFGAVKAIVQSANTTSLQVQVPVGASYGPIQVWNTGTRLWGASDKPFSPTYSNPRGGILNIDFGSATTRDNGVEAQSLCVADLNGDGKPDVVKGQFANNTLALYVNGSIPGQLTLFDGPTITLPVFTTSIRTIRAADLNADGRMDLVATGEIEVFF